MMIQNLTQTPETGQSLAFSIQAMTAVSSPEFKIFITYDASPNYHSHEPGAIALVREVDNRTLELVEVVTWLDTAKGLRLQPGENLRDRPDLKLWREQR